MITSSIGQAVAGAFLAVGFVGGVVVPVAFPAPQVALTPICPEARLGQGVLQGKNVVFITMVCETGTTTVAIPAVPEPRPEEEVPF
jgi:hypothetical protein